MMACISYLCLLPSSSPCGPHYPLVRLSSPSFSLHKCVFPKGVWILFVYGPHNWPKIQFSPSPKSKYQKLLLISKLSKTIIFPKWLQKIGDITILLVKNSFPLSNGPNMHCKQYQCPKCATESSLSHALTWHKGIPQYQDPKPPWSKWSHPCSTHYPAKYRYHESSAYYQ